MEIIMKTFYGDDGDYADIPLSKILDRMTDDWIDDEVTGENISELRDACRKLLETSSNSDYAKCKIEAEIKRLEDNPEGDYVTRISALEWTLRIVAER